MKRISPTALTLIASILASYFSYLRTSVLGYALLIFGAQALVGAIFRHRKRALLVDTVRVALAIVLLSTIWYRHSEPFVWRSRIAFCLFGQMPSGVELGARYVDSWTDYIIDVNFRANPESMKAILTDSRFTPVEFNVEPGYLEFEAKNRPEGVYTHTVTVSSDYTRVRILYMAD